MSAPNIDISNVINVSVSTPPTGIADYQVNNLAIFTKEVPINGAITALAPGLYRSPAAVATDWGSDSEAYSQAVAVFSQSPNILDGGGELIIFPMQVGDTIAAVVALNQKTQFFHGLLYGGYAPNDAELIAAAASCEALRILFFASQYLVAALTDTTGVFAIIHASGEPHTRKLLYTQVGSALGARLMATGYAGRAMSVDYAGSATTNTMHLKQLATITADGGITQTILDRCGVIGVDAYPSIAGRASVFTSGADSFFDDVNNLDWLVFAITVAGFNALAETGTKIPQTEQGMAVLRGAYIKVLQKAVDNGFIAPGAWNSPETFGSPTDLIRNVLQLGYYLYSQPVNLQSQANRAARRAPVCQIAVKYAGAIQQSSVIVAINP